MKRYEWGLTYLYNHKWFTPIIKNETQVNDQHTEHVSPVEKQNDLELDFKVFSLLIFVVEAL